jgi:hypothetical protein
MKGVFHVVDILIAGFYGRKPVPLVGIISLELKSASDRLLNIRHHKPRQINPEAGAFVPPHLFLILPETRKRTN